MIQFFDPNTKLILKLIEVTMYIINTITKILACVGAINWGLIALFDLNLVTALFGISVMTQAVYLIVGVSGLYQLFITIRTLIAVERSKTIL